MKQFLKVFIIVTFIAVALNSCQKEITIVDDLNPPAANTDSIYIDRYYEFEETASGLDTLMAYYFKYDSLKRVVEIYSDDFSTNVPALDYKYYYNGSDSVPYKMLEYDGPTDTHPQEYFFTFDNQQRIVKDSTRHYNNSGVLDVLELINYSYVPGKMYAHTRQVSTFPALPPSEEIRLDTAILNSVGDIVSHKTYVQVGAVSELNNTSEFTYGTQAGPFATSSVFKAHHLLPMGEVFIQDLMTHKNLLTQLEKDENGNVSMNETFTGYQYNSRGLLIECKYGEPGFRGMVRFFYKAL